MDSRPPAHDDSSCFKIHSFSREMLSSWTRGLQLITITFPFRTFILEGNAIIMDSKPPAHDNRTFSEAFVLKGNAIIMDSGPSAHDNSSLKFPSF